MLSKFKIVENSELNEEILTKKNSRKYVLFPIVYNDIYNMYKKQQQAFWTAEEIDFSADINDYNKLNDNEKLFVENVLAFFAGSDGIIFENINCNFAEEIEIPEARLCYGFQAMMEGIHSECYSLMIETYVKDETRKHQLFNAMEQLPAVKAKAEWACKWLDQSIPISKRLIAFAIVEGIFFAGSFCAIFWLKHTKGLMTKAFAKSNEFIARDESLHTDFSVLLYSYIQNRLTEKEVHELFKEAVDIEIQFITESLKCSLLGMNAETMIEYIKFVSDRLLNQLGYSKLYNIGNCPFSFMDTICLDSKSNFFEQRVSDYNRPEQLNVDGGLKSVDILDEF
jgi:ribonucleotide reductase beta subunit family protein with ferritin-like domain